MSSPATSPAPRSTKPLRIAVPKGSLYRESIDLLHDLGLDIGNLIDPGRQLMIRTDGTEFLIVRATDIPTLVAYGSADCGICGKDTLLESALELVELIDLRFGSCRFVVAESGARSRARGDHATTDALERLRAEGVVRVATKYPRITESYFASLGVQAEIIKLHGNIELAPLIGLADYIVDLTATGTTIRENDLSVVADVLTSSARFVVNPSAFRTDPRVFDLGKRIEEHCAGGAATKAVSAQGGDSGKDSSC